ncbi:MAG: 3-dehydroquinate synthase [Hyphomicrobiales bacterium]
MIAVADISDAAGQDDSCRRVTVGLGDRCYDIHIGSGLLGRAGSLIVPHLKRPVTVIVTDETVAALYLESLRRSLQAEGVATTTILVPEGEANKSFKRLEDLCGRLLEVGIERHDCIIALGGGVIGDLAGFAAAILHRGIGVIQIPTTLMAQVDSSIGGKTSINTAFGKNLVGAFHQPVVVLVDPDLLGTLSERDFRAGYAEIVKYGLIDNNGFFAWLEANRPAVFAAEPTLLHHMVEVACQTKARIVAADERESGSRALLNLGHTFAHALEAATFYTPYFTHGEAVALGTALALRYSRRVKACASGRAERVVHHLAAAGLPTKLKDVPVDLPDAAMLVRLMRRDKKALAGRIVLILMRDIGDAFVCREGDENDLAAFLKEELERA